MFSNVKTAVTLAGVTLGLSALDLKLTGFVKHVSSKRSRNGEVTVTSRSTPVCFAVNNPYTPLPAQFRIGRVKKKKRSFTFLNRKVYWMPPYSFRFLIENV